MSELPKDSLSVKKENVNLQKKNLNFKKILHQKNQTPTQKNMVYFTENKKEGISFSELELLYKKSFLSQGFSFPIKDTGSLSPCEYISPCVPVPPILILVPVQPGTHPTVPVHGWQQSQTHSFPTQANNPGSAWSLTQQGDTTSSSQ